MPKNTRKSRKKPAPVLDGEGIENDRNHHLAGPFLPQTPLGSGSPERSASPSSPQIFSHQIQQKSIFIRWVVKPSESFRLLLLPIVLYFNWKFVSQYFYSSTPNPFKYIFLVSGYIPTSSPDDPRYQKTYWDLAFVAYYVVFYSFVRQIITVKLSHPVAKYFGIRRSSKRDRFGEQAYAVIYFGFFGAWGYRIMSQLPTHWYNTKAFWSEYPNWDMIPELKMYYLLQAAYWCQQLLILVLGLERPRKDYKELIVHHCVTLWLIGWSYVVNYTMFGNAVYMSMDIPDAFLAFSKLLNYIQWEQAKIYSFAAFFGVWTYFRHYLNIIILWSIVVERPIYLPEWTKKWSTEEGVYMPWWMPSQIFLPLLALQVLNLFWYYLIVRILYRAISTNKADDDRSDDEGDAEDEKED